MRDYPTAREAIASEAARSSFARRLTDRRLALGITQAELAWKMSVTPRYINLLQQGIAALRPQIVEKLAFILEVSAAWLLTGRHEVVTADVMALQHLIVRE
jgi:transcriptional regulator with XRE-family HTH domain